MKKETNFTFLLLITNCVTELLHGLPKPSSKTKKAPVPQIPEQAQDFLFSASDLYAELFTDKKETWDEFLDEQMKKVFNIVLLAKEDKEKTFIPLGCIDSYVSILIYCVEHHWCTKNLGSVNS